ncbi:unnamed protein product, partial [Discosporangium mesarthrocarpum]
REEFGENHASLHAVLDWQHTRHWGPEGRNTTSTYLACSTDEMAAAARSHLEKLLSAAAVLTVSHGHELGTCFLIHADAAHAEAIVGDPASAFLESAAALPGVAKIAPSLLDHEATNSIRGAAARTKGFGDGSTQERLVTKPGPLLRSDGVVVLLAPGGVAEGEERELPGRWRERWRSNTLDVHALSFWSDVTGAGAWGVGKGVFHPGQLIRAKEWGRAAKLVHRRGSMDPNGVAAGCGWDEVDIVSEGSGLLTVRGIGHLLVGPYAPTTATPAPGNESYSDREGEERTACLMGLLAFLSAQPEVLRVSPLPRAAFFNAVATGIMQGSDVSRTPLWDRGLDGRGQVIQITDSGLSEGSCYFAEGAEEGAPLEHGYLMDAGGRYVQGDFRYNMSRRKVVQYIDGIHGEEGFSDDSGGGHGTMAAGSATGAIYPGYKGPSLCPTPMMQDNTRPELVGKGPEQVVSCLGRCVDRESLEGFPDNEYFEPDAWCPELTCDKFWAEGCLSNNRTETLLGAQGSAPGAKLAVLDLGRAHDTFHTVPGGVMWEAAAETGARIHSSSWGVLEDVCGVDELAASFDHFAYENPEHLLIFAAGNFGEKYPSVCSVASPGTAKNLLAVGASMSGPERVSPGGRDDVCAFSGRGPTLDGRIKPDIIAPGQFILTAGHSYGPKDRSCEIRMTSGTSMACPLVAGAAAMVRQYYMDGFYARDVSARGLCQGVLEGSDAVGFPCQPFTPMAVLIKATLLHGADTVGMGARPQGETGFGRVQLQGTLPVEGEGDPCLFVEDAMEGLGSHQIVEWAFMVGRHSLGDG